MHRRVNRCRRSQPVNWHASVAISRAPFSRRCRVRRRSEKQVIFDIARRVAELRAERALTQQDLADAFGLSPKRIRQMESGTRSPSIRTLCNVARVFNVEIAALFEIPASRERKGPGRPPKAVQSPPAEEAGPSPAGRRRGKLRA